MARVLNQIGTGEFSSVRVDRYCSSPHARNKTAIEQSFWNPQDGQRTLAEQCLLLASSEGDDLLGCWVSGGTIYAANSSAIS